jgi:hypothetical protein
MATKLELIERINRAHEELAKAVEAYFETLNKCECELEDEHDCIFEDDCENIEDLTNAAYSYIEAFWRRDFLLRTKAPLSPKPPRKKA